MVPYGEIMNLFPAGHDRNAPTSPRAPAPRRAIELASVGRGRRATRVAPGWVTASVGIVTVVIVVAVIASTPGPGTADKHVVRGLTHGRPARSGTAAVEAGLLPWQLPAPISREVLLPQTGTDDVIVAGGIGANGTSAGGVYQLNTGTGRLIQTGDLAAPTHDAAATVLGHNVLVFGGGTSAPGAISQDVTAAGSSSVLGLLPVPRADGAAVTIGRTAYVVGGYNGPSLDPGVLATSNGVSFRKVATIPVPVRYPAVIALDGLIYMFGGETASGLPLDVVQVVNPEAGTVKVLGHLPLPLSGAAAGVLDGAIYIAGGLTGSAHQRAVNDVFAFDRPRGSFLRAGSLAVAIANAGAAVSSGHMFLVGGETTGGAPDAIVQVLRASRAFGVAGSQGAGSPFYGYKLLVADRGNDRLLLIDDTGKVTWTYPSPNAPPPPGGFYFPDDAFFIRHGTAIISNQEENDTVVEIAFPSGRLLFSYGHPRAPGAGPGYLNNPDDAYLLRNGDITVADPMNCRVVILSQSTKTVLDQIGTPGNCTHDPPKALGSPNGDTPLADGNLLVSEINGSWVDEYTTRGRLVWTVQLPIGYPSDPQQLGADRYLVADYETPGAIVEFDREGQILYRYQPTSGPGELNHPSLVELLPSGAFLLNDDYNDRMVAIDPQTGALVWQYGETGTPGTTPGLLNTPDGFDILGPGGSTPTHLTTG
jgi:outer membrane protein assembly factor BamB